MQRLSMVAGLKMKDNNPSLDDLIDPTCPEKLSEQFQEIFDNAWTDVLDQLTDKSKVSEEIAVKQIVDALQKMFDQCRLRINRNKKDIIKIIGYPEDSLEKQYTGGKDERDPVLQVIKNLVKGSPKRIFDDVVKVIKKEPKIKDLTEMGGKSAEIFITECSSLCLFMCVQDPTVLLDFDCKNGAPFNKEKFNPFTSTGDIVDYLVWPVMYLSENGVLMRKGIAQGKRKT